ncbi:hypothetical protein HQ576_06545 [bacterium]|nr:hypothetical protein [bacterium]
MIWDSAPWKTELLRIAVRFRKRLRQRRWPEQSLVCVEKDVLIAFYVIRKLIEARSKLSTSTASDMLELKAYVATGKPITLLNWHRLDELYDFSCPRSQRRDVLFVCNQVIHSYVFMVAASESEAFSGILFSSDRERNKCLYELSATRLIRLLEKVASDYPSQVQMAFDESLGDYSVRAGNSLCEEARDCSGAAEKPEGAPPKPRRGGMG